MSEVNRRQDSPTHSLPVLPAVELLAASESYLAAFCAAPPCLADAAVAWLETIQPPQ